MFIGQINFKIVFRALMASLVGFYLGCAGSSNSTPSSTNDEPESYCETISSYSNGITITGSAQYYYRENGNGSVTNSPNPIRYAEIKVTDSNGTIIQCGSTDNSGNFSLSLPATNGSATIKINSRAKGNYVNAFVLKSPITNQHFSLSQTLTLDISKSLGTISAEATGNIEGGAFNILDKILLANEFLRTSTSGCATLAGDCIPFSVAPLVTAYWAPGVNPTTYFGIFGEASFYVPGESKLFILGGSNGDVNNSDADHFDNSVIIHEYAHFIEDIYSKSDSPGGSHDGNSILDPRLAWSEGFADFFQAAVTGNPIYRDTSGNVEGTANVILNIDLESGTNDTSSALGEGNFREFSITRALWDMQDVANEAPGTDDTSASFMKMWYLLTSETNGLRSTNFIFRNVGLFYQQHSTLTSPTQWDIITAAENQKTNQNDYARSLAPGVCGDTAIQAANTSPSTPEDGSFSRSNQFASNDFYRYSHSGGTLTINLNYTTNSGNPANLDLILYPEEYYFGETPTGASQNSHSVGIAAGSETISGTISAGNYMIVVRVNTTSGLGDLANYNLTINGSGVCPQ